MTVEFRRSPARVCWWVLVNGTLLRTFDRKRDAEQLCDSIKRQYGVA